MRRLFFLFCVAVPGVAVLSACGSDRLLVDDNRSQVVLARVGQEIDITLGNVGGATYESPPHISSPVLTYLGVDIVPPFTPAGPNQRFRFKAVARGDAIVQFRRTLIDSLVSTVEDTIDVR